MIYISCFLGSAFFAYLAQRSKNTGIIFLCSVISILIPSILGGLRGYYIGTDIRIYASPLAIQASKAASFADLMQNQRIEVGFAFIAYSVMQTLGHLNWTLFFYQFVTVSCIYIGLYRHRKIIHPAFGMLVFFFMYYNLTYNEMRQCMACAVVFMGANTLEEKKYFSFLMYIIVATLFHFSAVVAIPLILGLHLIVTSKSFIEKMHYRMIITYGIIIMILLARPLMFAVASSIPFLARYTRYMSSASKYSEHTMTKRLALILIGQVIMFLFFNRGAKKLFAKDRGEYNSDFYKLNIIFILTFQIAVHFFDRVLHYSEFMGIISLAVLPNFVQEKHLKVMVAMSVLAATSFYWWYLYIHLGYHATWPYRSIL